MTALRSTIQTYLNKFSQTTKLINDSINIDCKQTIIIPSYCEPELAKTLWSLTQCSAPDFITEIIVVLNCHSQDKDAQAFHQKQKEELEQKFSSHKKLVFYFILMESLPQKHAGVGLARKIGMDEAVRRFLETGYDGLLVCLDADCVVSKNYLVELEKYATKPESYNTICLHFEHDIEQEKNELLKAGIIFYELFLRYYKEGLAYCGFPYAFHTIGSSMAVKTSIYCKAGGMNKRKAGEDFYFLNKVFHYGKVVELNSVVVFPSARISTRVPFGTGRAQQNFAEKKEESFTTYAFQTFEDLRLFFLYDFYQFSVTENSLPASIKHFLSSMDFENKLAELKNNTSSKQQFQKRFYDWFDAFMLLKFVHFARDNYYPNNPILTETHKLMANHSAVPAANEKEQLISFRNKQFPNNIL